MAKIFTYKGQTLSARIYGDAQLEVICLENLIYPHNFVEGEVWDIISNEFEEYDACDTIKEANGLLDGIIAGLINDGVLGEFTPKRGIFVKW